MGMGSWPGPKPGFGTEAKPGVTGRERGEAELR